MPPPDMPPPDTPPSEARSSVDAASWRWLLGSGGVLLLLLVAIAALAQEPSTSEPTVSDVASSIEADVAASPRASPSPSPAPTRRPSPPASPSPNASPRAEASPTATPRTDDDPGAALAASPRGDDAPVIVQGRVDRVIDGDTFELSNGTRVRLAITDTPEVHGGVQMCGPEAASFASAFLAGQTVAVYRPADAPETDSYGRTLGEAVRVSDGASLNVALVAAGLGRIDDRFTNEDADLAARLRAVSATAEAPTCEDHSQPAPEPEPEPEPEPQPAADASGQHGGRTDGGWDCHPAYHECLPQTGDLNCGDVGHSVKVLDSSRDPYGLDGNDHDGKGCESEGSWSSSATYPYY